MGFIIEPDGIDFLIQSKPLTSSKEKDLSEFIAKRKLEIKTQIKKTHPQRVRNHSDVAIN